LNKEVRASILDQDPRQSIWFTIAPPTSANPPPDNAEVVVFSEGGLTIDEAIKFHATFSARNAEAARELCRDIDDWRTRLQGLAALVAGNKKDRSAWMTVARSIKDSRRGRVVTLDAQIPTDVFDELEGLLRPAAADSSRPAAPPKPEGSPPGVPAVPPSRDTAPTAPSSEPRLPAVERLGSR
jgi:hypothetical protein